MHECECLVWLALSFLRHRNSPVVHLGLTDADWVQVLLDCRCLLKIAFIPPWNRGTDKKQTFFFILRGFKMFPIKWPQIHVNGTTFPLNFSPSSFCQTGIHTCAHSHTYPERKYYKLYLLAPSQFSSKEKKMLKPIGLENPFRPPSLPPLFHAILSSLYSMLIKSSGALLSCGRISSFV